MIPPGPPIPGAMCGPYLQAIPFQRSIYEQLVLSHGPEHPDTLEALAELQYMLTYVHTFCQDHPDYMPSEPTPDPMFTDGAETQPDPPVVTELLCAGILDDIQAAVDAYPSCDPEILHAAYLYELGLWNSFGCAVVHGGTPPAWPGN